MKADTFDQQMQGAQQHLEVLRRTTDGLPAPRKGLLVEALQALSTTLEDLRVAQEELGQQNEELAAARQAVEAERQRYQKLFEFAPDSYLVTDVGGSIREANRAAAALLNAPQDFLTGKPLIVFVAKAEHKAFRSQLSRLLQTGRVEDWEVRVQPRGGAPSDVSLTATAVHDPEGKVGLHWLLRDITTRERAAAAVRESEERYRGLFENANDAIATFTLDGTITSVNRGAERMLGWTRKDLIGQHVRKVATPSSVALAEERARWFLAGEKLPSSTFEAELVRKDGSVVPVEARTRAIRDKERKPIGFQGVYRAITDRKRAEEARLRAELAEAAKQQLEKEMTERKWAEEALRRSEEHFRLLIENALDCIILLNGDGTIRYQSPSVERVLGNKPEDTLGKNGFEFVHPDDLPKVMSAFAATSKSSGVDLPIELRVRHRDGSWRVFEALGNNLLGDPVVAGIIINTRDITERKRLEEGLRESETLAALGRMAARVAHEINNPLAGIKNSFLLLKDAIPEHHPDAKYLSWIDQEIDRIARIVRQMFALHQPKPEAARELRADEVIRDVAALLAGSGREREVTLAVELPPAPLPVCLPEGALRQVVFNVIRNAIEASPQGGAVTVTATLTPEGLSLAVADQGRGIPQALGAQIFEPFFTTKSELAHGGLGLGLSVAKSLVEALGGALDFQSAPGQGTVFRVLLPRREAGRAVRHG